MIPSLFQPSFIFHDSLATKEKGKKRKGKILAYEGGVLSPFFQRPSTSSPYYEASYSASQGCGTTPSVTALLIRRIVYTSLNLIRRRVWWKPWKGGMRGIRGRHDVYCRLGQWLV